MARSKKWLQPKYWTHNDIKDSLNLGSCVVTLHTIILTSVLRRKRSLHAAFSYKRSSVDEQHRLCWLCKLKEMHLILLFNLRSENEVTVMPALSSFLSKTYYPASWQSHKRRSSSLFLSFFLLFSLHLFHLTRTSPFLHISLFSRQSLWHRNTLTFCIPLFSLKHPGRREGRQNAGMLQQISAN